MRLTYLAVFFLACLAPAQSDTFWLLRGGRDFWRTCRLQFTETYSYTANGRAWPNHEWLWEVIAYPIHAVGGMPLLTIIDAMLFVGAIILVTGLSGRRGYARITIVIVSVVLLAPAAAQRPQVASMFLFALTIVIVARERYVYLVPLFLVWSNLHGAVASGGVVLVATSIAAVCHFAVDRGATSRRRAARLLLATTGAGLVTLINPMGIGLWDYVLTSHARSKRNQIQEWMSPFELHNVATTGFFLVLVVTAVVVAARWRRLNTWKHVTPAVAALAMLPTALDASRNIPTFLLALIPPFIEMTAAQHPASQSRVHHPRPLVALVAVTGLLVVGVSWARPAPRLGWQPMTASAANMLINCDGRVYTSYYPGGYVEWYAPSVKVFVDSRQDPYPRAILRTAAAVDAGKFRTTFGRYDIGCAAVKPGSALASALDDAGWTRYSDSDHVEVYLRPE